MSKGVKYMKLKARASTQSTYKLLTLSNPKSPITEAYRTLRTNIQFASIDKTIKTIMVTSTGPAEGKSTSITNLAVVFAQADKKVLLIDADMRKPTIHHFFILPNRVGLTNIIAGTAGIESALQTSTLPNLHIITSGPVPPNPAELLGSKRMETLIKELISEYDYILFDAPPVIAVSDAQILSQFMDGVLLVVNSGHTHREMAVKAKGLLENVNANVIGVVLNNKEAKGEDYYYYYYGNN